MTDINLQKLHAAFEGSEQERILKTLFAVNPKAADVAQHFATAKTSIVDFEKAALKLSPAELFTMVQAAVTQSLDYIEYLQDKDANEALKYVFNFLNALAGVSPVIDAELAKIKSIQDFNQKIAATQALLQTLARMQQTDRVYADLAQTLIAGFKQAQEQGKQYAAGLKGAISQAKTAEDEYATVANRVIDSASSNAYFDPLRRIGFLLCAMFELHYVAPYVAEIHPKAVFEADNSDNRKTYYDLTGKMYGTQGYTPPGPVQAQAAPTSGARPTP